MIDEISKERGEQVELTCFYNDRRAQEHRTPTGPPPTRERLSESRAETTLTWGPHSDKPWEPGAAPQLLAGLVDEQWGRRYGRPVRLGKNPSRPRPGSPTSAMTPCD